MVTAQLKSAAMAMPGVLTVAPEATTQVEPLITTTNAGNTWTATANDFQGFQGPDFAAMAARFEPGETRQWLAVKVTGPVQTAFPDGKPETDVGDDPENGSDGETAADAPPDTHLAASTKDAALIVVADVDMLTDQVAMGRNLFGGLMPRNDAVNLVLNGLDFLAGSDALLSIRSSGAFKRPFTVVDTIEREAAEKTEEQVAAINAEIEDFQDTLEELQQQATDKNVGVLQNQLVAEQREAERKIRAKEREKKLVQRDSLSEIDGLETTLRILLIGVLPLAVLLVGLVVAILRFNNRKTFAKGVA